MPNHHIVLRFSFAKIIQKPIVYAYFLIKADLKLVEKTVKATETQNER